MLTARTSDLELTQVWVDSDPQHGRVRFNFPINRWEGSEDSAVVYFELSPGETLPTHTDSAEEILYVVEGQAEARVGDERGRIQAGDLAVIPAMVPHGVSNLGDTTLRVVGFFSEAEITSTFGEPLQPLGISVAVQGAPAPATA